MTGRGPVRRQLRTHSTSYGAVLHLTLDPVPAVVSGRLLSPACAGDIPPSIRE